VIIEMSKKIQVSFSDRQIELLERLKGELGETDADVVRNIVIAWLAEKSFISTVIKERMTQETGNGERYGK
jgi:predicted transcriptional regulator